MGCDVTREDLEEKIVYTRLERDEIRRKKQLLIEELRVTTGEEIKLEPIPDYVDKEYYKEQKKKRIQKEIKKAIKKEEKRKKEEEKKQKELEEEMKRIEQFGYDEELLYQPMNMRVKNKNSPVDDIYYMNYVLPKKDENKNNEHEEDEEIDEKNKEKKKKKSNLKKNKKVKFNKNENDNKDNENEDENNNDGNDDNNENNLIDNDIIQKVDAKIVTKTASVNSILKDDNNKGKQLKNKISNNNSNLDEDSKSIPYFTPHLQPND